MIITQTKMKVASLSMGVIGAMFIISVLTNLNALALHEGLFKIGGGLGLLAIAFEPSILFTSISMSEALKPRPPVTILLGLIAGVLILLSAVTWIFS